MPIKYIPFIPEPIEGQAVLGNFNRVLRYKGADELSMTLQRGMPLYEMFHNLPLDFLIQSLLFSLVQRNPKDTAASFLKEHGIHPKYHQSKPESGREPFPTESAPLPASAGVRRGNSEVSESAATPECWRS